MQKWPLPLLAPFKVAKRTAYEALNVLVTASNEAGLQGIGAAAPMPYVTGETVESAAAAIDAVRSDFVGVDCLDLSALMDRCAQVLGAAPAARAAVEMALLDLWAKHSQVSLWRHFGGRLGRVLTDITIPIVSPDEARASSLQYAEQGFESYKVKVGDPDGTERDLARLRAVSSAAPNASIRIDANQAYGADQAVLFIKSALEAAPNIELFEQPTPKEDFESLAYVTKHSPAPVYADESARSLEDVCRIISMGAADGVNVKLMKTGIVQSMEIVRLCRQHGVKLMMGCSLESLIGMAAAVCIAAGSGAFGALDLDAHLLLAPTEDVTGGFVADGPRLTVNTHAMGWGVDLLS